MSYDGVKKAFSGLFDLSKEVRQNTRDEVYHGLGVTQVVSMFLCSATALSVFYPNSSINPVKKIYGMVDDATITGYGASEVALEVFHYALWVLGSIYLGMVVGKKVGDGIWAIHCLARTGCRSRRTMDLPLSQEKRDRVVDGLLLNYLQSEVPQIQLLVAEANRREMGAWIQDVNLFFTLKRTRDLEKGKLRSAEAWWEHKKEFFDEYKIENLYQVLHEYKMRLVERQYCLSTYRMKAVSLLNEVDDESSHLSIIKAKYIRLLVDVVNDFKKSVGKRHQHSYKQNIYSDWKCATQIFRELTLERDNLEQLPGYLRQGVALIDRVAVRLTDNLKEIPGGPMWLQVMLVPMMKRYNTLKCKELTVSGANTVGRCIMEFSPDEHRYYTRELGGLFFRSLVSAVEDRSSVAVTHEERKGIDRASCKDEVSIEMMECGISSQASKHEEVLDIKPLLLKQ